MHKINVLLAMALFASAVAQASDRYTVDQGHSTIGFAVKHLVISTTHGQFKDYTGRISLDEKDITKSSVQVLLKVKSIDTGVEGRDKHLRGEDFFDAEKFPEITFVSTKIETSEAGTTMAGLLTIKGVSKEVSFPFTLSGPVKDPWGNTRIGAEGSLVINRQDYNIAHDPSGKMVGNSVKINLNLEAIKDKKGE